MTSTQFNWIQGFTAVALAVILSLTLKVHVFELAAVGAIAGALILRISSRNIKEITSDERDLELSGKAARFSIRIFSTLGVAIGFALIYDGQTKHIYDVIGTTLACAVVALLLIYNISQAVTKNSLSAWKRIGFIALIAALAFGAEILAGKIFGK